MNLLIDLIPTTVEIEGIDYKINSNFRTSILFELLMQDDEVNQEDKIVQALELYYQKCPENIEKAIDKILWFYKCGKETEVKCKNKGNGKSDNIYSFNYDDDYIYAAFVDQYGIDLQDIEYLHWWKFKAMFKSLKEDNEIVKIMGYRSLDLSKVDKSQREHYRQLKKIHEIPKSSNEIEKINAIEEALLNGRDISKIL